MIFHDTTFLAALRSAIRVVFASPWKERHRFFARQYTAALTQEDGDIRWMTQIGAGPAVARNQAGTPLLAGDRIVVTSPVGSTLSTLQSATGRPIWQVRLPSRHRGQVTMLGDTILVGMESGELAAYALEDGKVLGHCTWPGAFTPTPPLIVGRTFVYGAADGVLRAIPVRAMILRLSQHGRCA